MIYNKLIFCTVLLVILDIAGTLADSKDNLPSKDTFELFSLDDSKISRTTKTQFPYKLKEICDILYIKYGISRNCSIDYSQEGNICIKGSKYGIYHTVIFSENSFKVKFEKMRYETVGREQNLIWKKIKEDEFPFDKNKISNIKNFCKSITLHLSVNGKFRAAYIYYIVNGSLEILFTEEGGTSFYYYFDYKNKYIYITKRDFVII